MREERLRQIVDYLRENEMCKLDVLCDMFQVSKITIRRDLDELSKKGAIEKVYGGVRIAKKEMSQPLRYSEREIESMKEKSYIGSLAARLINDRDTIFIDSGTTCLRSLPYVKDKSLNVITNNLEAIRASQDYPNHALFLLGGEFHRDADSFVGEKALEILKSYHITKAFIAAAGASLQAGFTNSYSVETFVKQAAISQSGEVYLMIDYSKWDKIALRTFCNLDAVTGVITDKRPPQEYMDYFSKHNVEVIYE